MVHPVASDGAPALVGEGVRLVAPALEHVPMLVELGQNVVCRRCDAASPTGTQGAARSWVEVATDRWADLRPATPRQWVVQAPDESGVWRPAGTVEYRPDGHGAAAVGATVHPRFRGHRLAHRALDAALGHGFADDGLHTARWSAEVGNWASRRTAWLLGFAAPQRVRALVPGAGEDSAPRDGWVSSLRHDEPRRPAHPWLDVPELVGDGTEATIRLRPFRDDDADHAAVRSLQDAAEDDLAHTFMAPMLPRPDRSAYRIWLVDWQEQAALGCGLGWCIAARQDGRALGWIGLFDLRNRFAHGTGQVGYWLLPDGRGRGAVRQGLELVRRHAFGPLGLHRLWATTDVRNEASQRALLGAGYRWFGTESASSVYRPGGDQHDTPVFELLADERRQAAGPAPPPLTVVLARGHARPVPELATSRVRLREWRFEDVLRIVAACEDPVTQQFLPDLPSPYGPGEAVAYVELMHRSAQAGTTVGWCVADPATDRCLGAMALTGLEPGGTQAEVGYWTHPKARGRGVSTAALRLALRHALSPEDSGGMGLRRVFLRAAAGNPASQRVAAGAGMREVGRDRAAETLRDGTVDDFVRFDLLADELEAPDAGG